MTSTEIPPDQKQLARVSYLVRSAAQDARIELDNAEIAVMALKMHQNMITEGIVLAFLSEFENEVAGE